MIDLYSILDAPAGHDVVWDYCLDNNIIMPDIKPVSRYHVRHTCVASLSTSHGVEHSMSGCASFRSWSKVEYSGLVGWASISADYKYRSKFRTYDGSI